MTVEYGRKPYLSHSHGEMMRRITDKQINDQKLLHQSEMKKPYMDSTYQEMEHFYRPPWENPKNPYPYFPEPPAPDMPPVIGDPCKDLHDKLFDPGLTLSGKLAAVVSYRDAGCPMIILCAGTNITFTTRYVNLGESINFGAEGSLVTNGLVYISWSLQGPGKLSKLTGPTTTYTAPEKPTSCDNSQAIVTMKCNGFDREKRTLIINNPTVAGIAYETKTITGGTGCCYYPPGYCTGDCLGNNCGTKFTFSCAGYSCAGTIVYSCNGNGCRATSTAEKDRGCLASPGFVSCGYNHIVGNTDLRTEAMKENGCCPGALY
jgi:hypothetical protein